MSITPLATYLKAMPVSIHNQSCSGLADGFHAESISHNWFQRTLKSSDVALLYLCLVHKLKLGGYQQGKSKHNLVTLLLAQAKAWGLTQVHPARCLVCQPEGLEDGACSGRVVCDPAQEEPLSGWAAIPDPPPFPPLADGGQAHRLRGGIEVKVYRRG